MILTKDTKANLDMELQLDNENQFFKEDSEHSILLTAQRSNLHLLGHLQESMLIYIWLKMEDPKILNILPTTIYYQKNILKVQKNEKNFKLVYRGRDRRNRKSH